MNPSPAKYIVVAEDDETDVLLLKRAFRTAGLEVEVRFVFDGEEVLGLLERVRKTPGEQPPALIILDLKMPRMDGLEALERLRAEPAFRRIPALIFSSSASRAEIDRAYALGANAYLVKPPSLAERADIARFLKSWIDFVQTPTPSAAIAGSRPPAPRAEG